MLIGLCASVMLLLYGTADARRAIGVSAGIAALTQIAAYAIVVAVRKEHVIAGWGLGAVLRLVVLVVFALVVVRQFALPSAPATVSLALFLFVTTLVEPLFLKT
ncbi:MAG: hypothetical protein ACT4P7_00340 [Gemmatimonadaceae bacterium]